MPIDSERGQPSTGLIVVIPRMQRFQKPGFLAIMDTVDVVDSHEVQKGNGRQVMPSFGEFDARYASTGCEFGQFLFRLTDIEDAAISEKQQAPILLFIRLGLASRSEEFVGIFRGY
jgi:hypothetical protein